MKAFALLLFVTVATLVPGVAKPSDAPGNWMVGAWQMTHDEDGTPADVMEFRADGTLIFWGEASACVPFPAKFHVHAGDIYVATEVPGKGPIALIFHPDQDRTKLVFTSPRTRNNATYERLQKNPCSAG